MNSASDFGNCIYVNTLLVLYTCAIFSDSYECSRYVLKLFMSSTCDNCKLVLTYCGLGHLALCCLQTNVQPHLSVTSTLLCIPLRHKISGYNGIISDILTVCWYLISLAVSSTELILQWTIHLLCWWIV